MKFMGDTNDLYKRIFNILGNFTLFISLLLKKYKYD